MGYKDRDRKEKREPKVYSQSNYASYNKQWIATDDSGRVLGTNSKFDLVAMADEVKKKYHHNNFTIHYIDIPTEVKK